jgi:hypothetical protein
MSPDPLIMSADIARVAAERPELDEDLVQALYQHLVLIQGRQPTVDEVREYVDRVSSLDHDRLRQRLGLGRRKRGSRGRTASGRRGPSSASTAADGVAVGAGAHPEARREPAEAAGQDPVDHANAVRGPGRPGWTSDLFSTRYQAALDRATRPYTHQSIADQFEMLDGTVGADPDHLRKLLKRYGRPPG